jgi:glycosyltransferase involved in cell wall biosynthesis
MIGLELKRILALKWVADFRDPWTGIYYFNELMLSPFAEHIHQEMEKNVLKECDKIITVGETMKKDFSKMTTVPIDVITNGYDEEDYLGKNFPLTNKFTLSNIGLLSKGQNHPALWNAIGELVNENVTFKNQLEIRFVGHVDAHVKKSLEVAGITSYCQMIDYVNHEKVVEYQKSSHILLLNINRVPNAEYLLTGKLFEYIAAERPILCVAPRQGDAAKIIEECKAGEIFEFDDKDGIKKYILDRFKIFTEGTADNKNSLHKNYSRRELTKKLVNLINS